MLHRVYPNLASLYLVFSNIPLLTLFFLGYPHIPQINHFIPCLPQGNFSIFIVSQVNHVLSHFSVFAFVLPRSTTSVYLNLIHVYLRLFSFHLIVQRLHPWVSLVSLVVPPLPLYMYNHITTRLFFACLRQAISCLHDFLVPWMNSDVFSKRGWLGVNGM